MNLTFITRRHLMLSTLGTAALGCLASVGILSADEKAQKAKDEADCSKKCLACADACKASRA